MARLGIGRAQRRRPQMEDYVVAGPVPGGFLVGLFDGHGGAEVAARAAASALDTVARALPRLADPGALWRETFAALDPDVRGCGSSATLLLLRGRQVSAAWVGDSRALLVGADGWRLLTPEHRISRADERRRVLAAGAHLVPPYVVHPRLDRGLMLTRALGDREFREVGVLGEPEVATLVLGEGDVALLAATDGLWDVVGDEEAALVCRGLEPEPAAARLVALVAERDGADNVAVVVLGLSPP
jgi:serine/threonine protein phosphatase PrpC